MFAPWIGVAVALGSTILLRGLLRRARARGRDTETPAAVGTACAAGTVLLASDPYFAILRAAGPAAPRVHAWGLEAALGVTVAIAALVAGAALMRPSAPPQGTPGTDTPLPWIVTCVGLVLLSLAERAVLLDAQLLFLAGVTVLWIRAGATQQGGPTLAAALLGIVAGWSVSGASALMSAPIPAAAPALAMAVLALFAASTLSEGSPGKGGTAAFLALTLGLGMASIAQAFVLAALQIEAFRGSLVGRVLWAAGELTVGLPYRWGLSVLWPEAAVAGIVAAGVALRLGAPTDATIRRLAGGAVVVAGGLLLVARLVRAWGM